MAIRARGKHQGDAGEKQEDWRPVSGDHDRPLVASDDSFSDAGPRIECVRLDHDQHGDAAQPIEMQACSRTGMQWSSVMSSRSECQTEQYLSRDSAIARSTAARHIAGCCS